MRFTRVGVGFFKIPFETSGILLAKMISDSLLVAANSNRAMSLTLFNQTEIESLTSTRDTVYGNVLFDKLFRLRFVVVFTVSIATH